MNDVATILEIISSISSTLALDEILAQVTQKTAQIVDSDSCAISLWDQADDTLTVLADYIAPQVILPEDDINDVGLPYSVAELPATAQVLRQQTPLIVHLDHPSDDEAERHLLQTFRWAGVLMVPMIYKGQTTGLMELYVDYGRPNPFSPNKIIICQALANQAAIAIEHARLFTELETKQEALRQASLRLVNSQEEERCRLSRELHDELGQALTALRINLDRARRMLPADALPKLRQTLDEATLLATQTQENIRHLSLELRPAILDDLGLIAALRWELDSYERRTGQTIRFEADLKEVVLPPELEITIYRIICEALTNIARHAQATFIWVFLWVVGSQLVATVEDNGVGFETVSGLARSTERRSLGLVSMRERAQLLGGKLEITSEIGHGTRIKALFPLVT